MNVIEIELSKVKPYEKNPRKNDNAVDGVAESIKQFGFQQPIVVDKNNVIVVGHTRYKAAQKLGMTTVPCVRADQLTKEQVKAYRIADNKLNELATWDFELLGEELASFEFNFEPFEFTLPEWGTADEPQPSYGGQVGTETAPSESTGTYSGTGEELSGLPEELDGVDLNPAPLPQVIGDQKTALDRVIIVFPKDRANDVANLLGIESITKVVYRLEELEAPTE